MPGNLNVGVVNATQLLENNVGMFGVGQTWQDVLSSRSLNTVYTNTTGKTIFVAVTVISGSTWNTFSAFVNGVQIASTCPHTEAGVSLFDCLFFPVGAGQTYKVTMPVNGGTSGSVATWTEFK